MSDLLTVEEVAERLRLTSETILRWAREGKIPAIRISPKVLRFDWDAVYQALTRGSTSTKEVTDVKVHPE